MVHSRRTLLAGVTAGLFVGSIAAAQQLLPPQSALRQGPLGEIQQVNAAQPGAGQQIAPAQPPAGPPDGFQLNVLDKAKLEVVLNAWQQESAKVNTFRCTFERKEYDPAFGPHPDIALFHNRGELSFEKPDKGSFQITEVKRWQFTPAPPDQPPPPERTGNWVLDPTAVGEHWVCDGKNIYEYRHSQKQLVVRPIPPQMQGQSIVDGPLPFLFGAEAKKLMERYWLRIDARHQAPNEIMIAAVPKWPADAANYKMVEVVLVQPRLLPSAMQIHLPNSGRNVYLFDLAEAKINSRIDQIKAWFKPPEIRPGWQRVVEQMPIEQAAQPVPPPR